MYKLLIADDENKIRETMYDYLTAKGFEVVTAVDGIQAVDAVAEQSFDLILLDVMMPNMNGIEACKQIREYTSAPVLFLSALGQEEDLMNGYVAGADDYIVKPFSLKVLAEKCKVVIARNKGLTGEQTLSVGEVTLNYNSRTASIDGKQVELKGKNFELLSYLMENKNQILHREMILANVWGWDFDGDQRVVDTQVKRLRQILGTAADHIKTTVGVGYSFREVIE